MNIIVLIRKIIMPINKYVKDRTLAELYSYILIMYGLYESGAMPKHEYERIKRTYLYDKKTFDEMYINVKISPKRTIFCSEGERALDVLNDLIAAGAINVYEYNTQRERHLLY